MRKQGSRWSARRRQAASRGGCPSASRVGHERRALRCSSEEHPPRAATVGSSRLALWDGAESSTHPHTNALRAFVDEAWAPPPRPPPRHRARGGSARRRTGCARGSPLASSRGRVAVSWNEASQTPLPYKACPEALWVAAVGGYSSEEHRRAPSFVPDARCRGVPADRRGLSTTSNLVQLRSWYQRQKLRRLTGR